LARGETVGVGGFGVRSATLAVVGGGGHGSMASLAVAAGAVIERILRLEGALFQIFLQFSAVGVRIPPAYGH
jgi:hypothetical protein